MRNCRRTAIPAFSATPAASFLGRKSGSAAVAAVLCGRTESCQDCDDCPNCHDAAFHFQHAIPLGAYEGALREAVLKAKRPAYEHLATALGHLFSQRRQGIGGVSPRSDHSHPDVLVATSPPASEFPAGDCPHVGEGLFKFRRWAVFWFVYATHCHRRIYRQRIGLATSAGPFRSRPARRRTVQGSRVLLVDDILTTGATCSEAAWVLKQAGAVAVVAAVLARA